MVFVLPSAGHPFKRLDLLKAAKLFLRRLREELTTPTLADQSVDLADKRFRYNDMMRVESSYLNPT